MASSLTSAMLTWRKVFSSSLVSSASLRLEHRHGRVDEPVVEGLRPRPATPASMPETTLGVFTSVHVGLPGSMRSGL